MNRPSWRTVRRPRPGTWAVFVVLGWIAVNVWSLTDPALVAILRRTGTAPHDVVGLTSPGEIAVGSAIRLLAPVTTQERPVFVALPGNAMSFVVLYAQYQLDGIRYPQRVTVQAVPATGATIPDSVAWVLLYQHAHLRARLLGPDSATSAWTLVRQDQVFALWHRTSEGRP